MSASYELTTIKDIFRKVPADRIRDCCNELGVMLSQAKSLEELMTATASALGSDAIAVGEIPDVITWLDDGLGDIELRVRAEGEGIVTIKTKVPESGDA